jgi:putative transposase
VPSAPTFYVVPGSTVKRVIDDNKKQVFDAVEAAYARLRDELLNGEIFYTLREAQIIIESWRRHYNAVRPHASLGFKPPAPEAFVPAFSAWPASLRRPAPPATLAQPPTLN